MNPSVPRSAESGRIEFHKATGHPRIPDGFRQMLETAAYPPFTALAEELEHGSPLCSIRLNAAKGINPSADADKVPWWPQGVYLSARPRFTLHPAIHQGLFYVQDASSMAAGTAVRHLRNTIFSRRESLRALDACAAPGGKTGSIADALSPCDALIANEYDFRRAEILSENAAKWGDIKVAVTRGDTSRFSTLKEYFDIISVDAPCSGEGMMRKDDTAASQWSPRLINDCAARQKTIIDNLWPALQPGGALIYSTCTFNSSENEDIVHYTTSELGGRAINIPELDAIDEIFPQAKGDNTCYRFIPGKTRGEGLFLCVIIKDGDLRSEDDPFSEKYISKSMEHIPNMKRHDNACLSDAPASKGVKKIRISRDKSNRSSKIFPLSAEETRKALAALCGSLPHDLGFIKDQEGNIYALSQPLFRMVMEIAAHSVVDFLSPGTLALRLGGNEYFPAQPLALTAGLDASKFPCLPLDYAGAMTYLRGETPVLHESMPRGPLLATFDGHPLGWLKSLGNRANNPYPKPWRVLSKDKPDDFSFFNFLNNY